MDTLITILICLVSAYIFSEILKWLGLPRAVGQIIAGLVLGISTLKGYLFTTSSLEILTFLANMGIILMFYYVGLETNSKAFFKNFKGSIMISFFNTSIPLLMGFLFMKYVFGFSDLASLIVGISLSVSAQSVSLDVLEEMKMLKTRLGDLMVSAGVVDDAVELMLVTVILTVFHSSIGSFTISGLLIDIILFLLFIVFARIVFIPYTLKVFDREKSSTARFMASMIIVLLIASLSEFLGIGLFIGAIVAGLIVRQTIYKDVTIPNWEEHDIARSTHILAFGFFIPLFFVHVGLNANLNDVLPNLGMIIFFVAIALIGTVGGTVLAVKLNNGTFKDGFALGWGLSPKGDIELVIIAIALKFSIIDQSTFTSLVVMALVATAISTYFFKHLARRHPVGEVTKKSA